MACAGLEDALKQYAILHGPQVDGENMETVVNALKSRGLLAGPPSKLLSAMPKIRNFAMHAEYDELNATDVGSVIGFVEQFLIAHF